MQPWQAVVEEALAQFQGLREVVPLADTKKNQLNPKRAPSDMKQTNNTATKLPRLVAMSIHRQQGENKLLHLEPRSLSNQPMN